MMMSNNMMESFDPVPQRLDTSTTIVERHVTWENGMPILSYRNTIKRESLLDLKRHALSQPYEGEWDALNLRYVIDPRFAGMNKAEVMEHRLADMAASGGMDAIREVTDRLLGKAKQQVESKTLNLTYEDYLLELARQEGEYTGDDSNEP